MSKQYKKPFIIPSTVPSYIKDMLIESNIKEKINMATYTEPAHDPDAVEEKEDTNENERTDSPDEV